MLLFSGIDVSTPMKLGIVLPIASMSGTSQLLLVLTFVFGFVAVNLYSAAVDQVTPWFPPQFRGSSMGVALDKLIWERSFPAQARRNYLLSTGLAAVAMLCAGTLLYLEGQFVAALWFGALFVSGIGYAFRRALQYKDRL